MATSVSSSDPGALTGGAFAGTGGHPTATNAGGFAFVGDSDDLMLPAEEGAMGLVGPITGASGGNNPAQPGSATAPGQP